MTTRSHARAAAPHNTTADAAAESALWQQLIRAALQHDLLLSDSSSICRLLSTSKAAAALVADCCSGTLHLDLDPPEEYSFARGSLSDSRILSRCHSQAAWLQRNGNLLRQLSCHYAVNNWPRRWPAFATLLPVLASGSTPQLKALSGSLSLSSYGSAAAVDNAAASLAALTSLTKLTLTIDGCEKNGGPAPIVSSLQRLSSLSSCELCVTGRGPGFMRMDAAGFEHLPAWLTSLELSVRLGLHDEGLEEMIVEAGAELAQGREHCKISLCCVAMSPLIGCSFFA